MTLTDTYKTVKPSIVAIVAEFSRNPDFPDIIGTGFFAREDGIVFTNRHVIEAITQLPRRKGSEDFPIKVLMFDHQPERGMRTLALNVHGVALIKLDPIPGVNYGDDRPDLGCIVLKDVKGVPVLSISASRVIDEGEDIAVAGFPMGTQTLRAPGWIHQLGPTLQRGVIAAVLPMPCTTPHALLLDIMVQGGSSGSPVFSVQTGEVVGIVYAGLLEQYGMASDKALHRYKVPTTMTLAVPSHLLKAVLDNLDIQLPHLRELSQGKKDLKDFMSGLEEKAIQPKSLRLEPAKEEILEP